MIIYEVNLDVEAGAVEAFRTWLPGHIEEMMSLPGFVEADWLEVVDDAAGQTRWSVRYALQSEVHLERYFANFAERMRNDGQARFGGRFTASRRVLRPVRRFDRYIARAASGR